MGYGIISSEGGKDHCLDYGSIRTSAGGSIATRLAFVYDKLSELINRYHPEVAAIEKLFFSKNVKTALLVAEARGVIRVCLEKHGVRCAEFSPADVKIAVCGHGSAAKNEVQKMVKMLLGLKEIPEPDDAADALALALALAHTRVTIAPPQPLR